MDDHAKDARTEEVWLLRNFYRNPLQSNLVLGQLWSLYSFSSERKKAHGKMAQKSNLYWCVRDCVKGHITSTL